MNELLRPDTAAVPAELSVTGFVCVSPDGEPYWPSAQATVEESMARCFGRADPHRLRLDLLARNGWRCVRIVRA